MRTGIIAATKSVGVGDRSLKRLSSTSARRADPPTSRSVWPLQASPSTHGDGLFDALIHIESVFFGGSGPRCGRSLELTNTSFRTLHKQVRTRLGVTWKPQSLSERLVGCSTSWTSAIEGPALSGCTTATATATAAWRVMQQLRPEDRPVRPVSSESICHRTLVEAYISCRYGYRVSLLLQRLRDACYLNLTTQSLLTRFAHSPLPRCRTAQLFASCLEIVGLLHTG